MSRRRYTDYLWLRVLGFLPLPSGALHNVAIAGPRDFQTVGKEDFECPLMTLSFILAGCYPAAARRLVDPPGVEPGLLHCECSVLPLSLRAHESGPPGRS